MSILSYITSNQSPRILIRNKKTMLREMKCTPFCECAGEGLVRGDERSYLYLKVKEDSPFDKYLRSIQSEIQKALLDMETQAFVRWPYDESTHTLRIKIPMSHGRIDVKCFDADSNDMMPPASMSESNSIAVKMHLSDLWIGEEDIQKTGIMPTWTAEAILLRSKKLHMETL